MKTYTKTKPVAAGDGSVHGQPVAAQGPFNSGSGVRRKWWCQDGPVDSCCCVFPLRAGVGLMAASDLINGMMTSFYLGTFYVSNLEALLTTTRTEYMEHCAGTAASKLDCEQLKESMEQAKGHLDVYLHLPISIYAQGFLCTMAGAVGLWAIFRRSKRAVKAYMLSWPAKFVLGVWGALDMRKLEIMYDVERGPIIALAWLLNVLCLLYFFKVSWSFYKTRPGHEESAHIVISASSNTAYEEPILGMDTTV